MLTDAQGRNRHPAGSPASIGGQYAHGATPAATATLEPERAPSEMSRGQLAAEWARSFEGAHPLGYAERENLLHRITAAAHDVEPLRDRADLVTATELADWPQIDELLRTEIAAYSSDTGDTGPEDALASPAVRRRLTELAAAAVHHEMTNHSSARHLSADARLFAQELHTGAYKNHSMVHVAYDDQLTAEQIDALLAGNSDALYESTGEWAGEHTQDSWVSIVNDLEGKFDIPLDEDDRGELYEHAENYGLIDSNDYVSELVERTSSQLLRLHAFGNGSTETMTGHANAMLERGDITLDDYSSIGRHDQHDYDTRARVIRSILVEKLSQPDDERTAAAARSLAEEGPGNWHEGVRLDLAWTGDVDTASAPVDEDETKQLVFAKPQIVLIDTLNGSFGEHELTAPITIGVSQKHHVVRDRGDGAYGLDEAAGLVGGVWSDNAPTAGATA